MVKRITYLDQHKMCFLFWIAIFLRVILELVVCGTGDIKRHFAIFQHIISLDTVKASRNRQKVILPSLLVLVVRAFPLFTEADG